MKEQLLSAEQSLKERSKQVEELKEKLKVISLAKRFDGEESDDKKELKLKINEMMRELDKCIAVLKAQIMSKIDITVKLGQRSYPLTIQREEEEQIRKAANQVNESLKELKENYGIKDTADLFAMVALDFATRYQDKIQNTAEDEDLINKILSFERKLKEALEN